MLVGATASGKSEVAIEIAKRSNPLSEIISLDSMQIYKGMEFGTGAVPDNRRNEVVHHMISIINPTQEQSVKQFQSQVYEILDRSPDINYVLVGGTGLYTHAIVDGFKFAPTDVDSRQSVIEQYNLDEHNPDPDSVARAYEILLDLDPDAAEKIDPQNVRRIVRALEAIEISGNKFSATGGGVQEFGIPVIDVELVGLRYSRDALRERIKNRVDDMFKNGWIDEVRVLMHSWDRMTAPARNAIGYALIAEWIMAGENEHEIEDLKEKIVNKTAQFSRRQRKWFERDPRITWIDCDSLEFDQIVAEVENIVGKIHK